MSETAINLEFANRTINLKFLVYLFAFFFTFDLINTFAAYILLLSIIFFLEKLSNGFRKINFYGFPTWILLLLISLFQIYHAFDTRDGIYYFSITVLIPFLIFVIVTNLKIDSRFLEMMFKLLFISGIIMSIYSIYLFFRADTMIRFRISSFWVHYNLVAAYLMILVLFAFSFLVNSKFTKSSVFYLVSLILISLGLLITQTRGIWLSTLAAVFFYIIKKPKLLVPVVLAVLIIFVLFYGVIVDRYLSIVNFESDISSIGRLQAWIASGLLILDNMWIGYGFDAFRHLRDRIFTVYFVVLPHPHNTYLTLWLELGFFGMFLYLSFFFKALYYSIKLRKRSKNPDMKKYYDGLQMSFVGMIIAFMFEPYFTILGAITYIIWFLIAISYYLYFNEDKFSQSHPEN